MAEDTGPRGVGGGVCLKGKRGGCQERISPRVCPGRSSSPPAPAPHSEAQLQTPGECHLQRWPRQGQCAGHKPTATLPFHWEQGESSGQSQLPALTLGSGQGLVSAPSPWRKKEEDGHLSDESLRSERKDSDKPTGKQPLGKQKLPQNKA